MLMAKVGQHCRHVWEVDAVDISFAPFARVADLQGKNAYLRTVILFVAEPVLQVVVESPEYNILFGGQFLRDRTDVDRDEVLGDPNGTVVVVSHIIVEVHLVYSVQNFEIGWQSPHPLVSRG